MHSHCDQIDTPKREKNGEIAHIANLAIGDQTYRITPSLRAKNNFCRKWVWTGKAKPFMMNPSMDSV